MLSIVMMDPDIYVKYGLSAVLKPAEVQVSAVSNISDLIIGLNNSYIDVVVMELSNRDDDVFDCIEFVRKFSLRWPDVRLIVYTHFSSHEAVELLTAVTGHKDIFFKNESVNELITCVLTSKRNYLTDLKIRG